MNTRLPTHCPSCEQILNVTQLTCEQCQTQVSGNYLLPVFLALSPKEQDFILQFFLASGSLKEMAIQTGVSYPTVRNQLDDMIQHIKDLNNK